MLERRSIFDNDSEPHIRYNLRDYQQKLIADIEKSLVAEKRRVMTQLPTGGGKTVCFAHLALNVVKEGGSVLVLAHRWELLDQAAHKLEAVLELPVGIIKHDIKPDLDCEVQVASVQSLRSRKKLLSTLQFDLIVVDEAHHACCKSYTDILENYPRAKVVGFTATPCRSDGQGFQNHFDDLVLGATTGELIKQGYLSKYRFFASPNAIDVSNVDKCNGEFKEEELAKAIEDSKVFGDCVELWKKHAEGRQTLVFTVGVENSKAIAKAYQDTGIPAAHLDGETSPRERIQVIENFKAGRIKVLSNCGLFFEGLDVEGLECVQCVRPTFSVGLWLQIVGRGLRIFEGKEDCVILDHTTNTIQHGFPDDDREWSLYPVSLEPAKGVQICEDCNHGFRPLPHEIKAPVRWVVRDGQQFPIYAATCPACGSNHEFEMGEGGEGGRSAVTQEQGDLIELDQELNPDRIAKVDDIFNLQKALGYKPGWIRFQIEENPDLHTALTLAEWRYVAKHCGYKPGWGFHAWRNAQHEKQEIGN